MLMYAAFAPFILAALAPLMQKRLPGVAGRVLALLTAALFGLFLLLPDRPEAIVYPWSPSLGLTLSFLYDGLGRLMALVITGVGACVLLYAGGYLRGDERLGRLYAALLAFMGAMLGVVLGGNLLFIFICWELTSITSYILIGFDHHRAEARKAALHALLVTFIGGLCLLVGVMLLGSIAGSFELSALAAAPGLREHALYLPALVLVLLGAFTKSAQVPFHFWLPGAMEAPTPVSAYLHSATMVKAGVFLLARLNPSLGGTEAWLIALVCFGGLTMLVGNFGALLHTDLKRVLAYSTVGMLGTLTLLIGVGTEAALAACVVTLLAHALYKGALFLVAGALDHATGTRDIRRLSGLGRAMPVTFAAAIPAALSCMGVIPLLGFVAKEKSYVALLGAPESAVWLIGAAVAANAAAVAMALITGIRPFVGHGSAEPGNAHEAPPDMWLGPLLLGVLALAFGVAGAPLVGGLVERATADMAGTAANVELSLWAGVSGVYGVALALSVVTLALGIGLFALRGRLRELGSRLAPLLKASPQRVYERIYDGSLRGAEALTRRVQDGLLNSYVRTIIMALIAVSVWVLYRYPGLRFAVEMEKVRIHEAGVVVLLLAAALVAVRSRNRMSAIVSLGVVGLGVTLVFALFSAPDLAMTQIMVETLMVLLFVLVFYHLPQFARLSSRFERVRDLVVSIAFGALMTMFVLAASTDIPDMPLAEYFATHSYTEGHGRNVVNVILVDFRALDTLGEITVLVAAGIGVVAMLGLKPARRRRP
jgi:multicomponent Na+:H+ antiporter subunit A